MDQMLRQIRHINMSHPRISPLSFSRRPAADFYTVKPNAFRRLKDFTKGKIRKNGADETKLHCRIPMGTRNKKMIREFI
jgi:hypothetical protein